MERDYLKMLAQVVLPREILDYFTIAGIEQSTEVSVSGNLDSLGRVPSEGYDSIFRHWRSTFK